MSFQSAAKYQAAGKHLALRPFIRQYNAISDASDSLSPTVKTSSNLTFSSFAILYLSSHLSCSLFYISSICITFFSSPQEDDAACR